jgi:hypothetical protein
MVSLLKSLLRWLFAVAAILLGAGSILAAIETARADTAGGAPFDLSVCAYYAACLAIAVLYAVAWWTTGRPRTTRNGWAIAACLVNLAIAIFLLRYVRPFNFAFIAITAHCWDSPLRSPRNCSTSREEARQTSPCARRPDQSFI